MANTFAGMTFTNIAQRGLSIFSKRLLGLKIFTTDLSADVQKQGTAVSTRIVPATSTPVDKSTTAYDDATIVTGETTVAVTVTLNQHKVTGFELTDKEMHEIGSGVMQDTRDRLIEKKVNALADQMLSYVFALITSGNYSTAFNAVASATFDSDDIVDFRTTLIKADFPIADTNLVLNSDYIGALLKDAKISNLSASGLSALTDGAGALVRLGGMGAYEAPTLPTNSQNLVGFAATQDALAVAMRAAPPVDSLPGAQYQILTDPQTGLTLGYYAWPDYSQKRWIHNFEALYGASKANAAALIRVVKP